MYDYVHMMILASHKNFTSQFLFFAFFFSLVSSTSVWSPLAYLENLSARLPRSTMSIPGPLPNPNRYITDNNTDGQSFFSTAVSEEVPVAADLGGALQRLGYTTDRSPVQLSNDTDLAAYE